MLIGVPKETYPGERRVALVPLSLKPLVDAGHEVLVETGAGRAAGYHDEAYREKGARIAGGRRELFEQAKLLLQVRVCGANPEGGQADLSLFRQDQTVIGLCHPFSSASAAQRLAGDRVTLFSLELIPRITRAQSMDVLSSMSTISGYKAVLIAADTLPRMFPMMMTAAGTLTPARVFVVGAGVAGLQAIATARKLGAVVSAYDVRPAVREQVESLGAKFVELELEAGDAEDKGGYAREMGEEFYRRQREMMLRVVAEHDVVITTAIVPGKKAPVLVTQEMLAGMAPGSVVVDMAAEQGGNCELTEAGRTVAHNEVFVVGPINLPSTVPYHASQMYSRNMTAFVKHLSHEGTLRIDRDDEITASTLVSHAGEVVHPRVREFLDLPPLAPPPGRIDEQTHQAAQGE